MPTSAHARFGVALIHSPLVGAVTWQPVADALRGAEVRAAVASLRDEPESGAPFWVQHAASAAASIDGDPQLPLIYIAHSGAGALLPAVRERLPNPAAGYIFVDAGLPKANASRLDAMHDESPAWAAEFHQDLLAGGVFPTWTADDLRGLVPDDRLRYALVASIRPRGLQYFVEQIPAFDGWPDAPCAYIRLSATYRYWAGQARDRGWPLIDLPVGHFHMLVDPAAVAGAITETIGHL